VAPVDQFVAAAAALEHLAAHQSHCCQQMAAPLYIDLQTQKNETLHKSPQKSTTSSSELEKPGCSVMLQI